MSGTVLVTKARDASAGGWKAEDLAAWSQATGGLVVSGTLPAGSRGLSPPHRAEVALGQAVAEAGGRWAINGPRLDVIGNMQGAPIAADARFDLAWTLGQSAAREVRMRQEWHRRYAIEDSSRWVDGWADAVSAARVGRPVRSYAIDTVVREITATGFVLDVRHEALRTWMRGETLYQRGLTGCDTVLHGLKTALFDDPPAWYFSPTRVSYIDAGGQWRNEPLRSTTAPLPSVGHYAAGEHTAAQMDYLRGVLADGADVVLVETDRRGLGRWADEYQDVAAAVRWAVFQEPWR